MDQGWVGLLKQVKTDLAYVVVGDSVETSQMFENHPYLRHIQSCKKLN
jgi:hypothetical protein